MTNKLKNLIATTVAVIDRRGRIRSDGRPVNPQTVDYTRRFMSDACHSLHEMGFYLEDIKGLSEKHVKALVKHWHSKHLGGDALTSQLSQLRMFCGWMGRAGLVRPEGLPFYLPDVDPDELKPATPAQKLQAWSDNALATMAILEDARKEDLRFFLVLLFAVFFGLRRRESVALRPHENDNGTHINIYLEGGEFRMVAIAEGTVLGRIQRNILNMAKKSCHRGDVLGWPGCTQSQSLHQVNYLIDCLGLARKEYPISDQGLIQFFTANESELLKRLPAETLFGIGIQKQPAAAPKTMCIGRLALDAEGTTVADVHVWPVTPLTELGCHAPLTHAQGRVAKVTAIVEAGGIYKEPVDLMRFLGSYPDLYEEANWILRQVHLCLPEPGESETGTTTLH